MDNDNHGKNNKPGQGELEKSEAHIIADILNYIPNTVVTKTIMRKATGNVTVSSFDAGEEWPEKTSAFDIYIQIIDGVAEVSINDKKYELSLGDGIVIPAHARNRFNAIKQFKMISTVIKSGYEE
jgi:quercetin dioxygenase-like cupin family protein